MHMGERKKKKRLEATVGLKRKVSVAQMIYESRDRTAEVEIT